MSNPENPASRLGVSLKRVGFLPDNHHDLLQDIFSQLFLSQQMKEIAEKRALEARIHLSQRLSILFRHSRQQEVLRRLPACLFPGRLACMPEKSYTNQLIWPP